MEQIIITADLGYGDSGKGTTIDALTRLHPTELVVRYSGGAQAAHNVMTPEGKHHRFSQFGSGTFTPGVKSYLGPEVLVDPNKVIVEHGYLQRVGVTDAFTRLIIDKKAPLITEFNVVINQTREFLRGDNRHGSCGLGIYETRLDSEAYGEDMLFAEDMQNFARAKEKLLFFREKKKETLHKDFPSLFGASIHPSAQQAYKIFTDDRFIDETLEIYGNLAKAITLADNEVLKNALATGKQVLFEASQGVLLDEKHGFLPHVTGSDVTTGGAHRLLSAIGSTAKTYTLGIVRSYMFRHGAGPLPSEDPLFTQKILEEHNSSNHPWQGPVRYGWFDPLSINYAIEATGGIDGLMVTCLDQLSSLPEYKYVTSYTNEHGDTLTSIANQTEKTDAQKIVFTESMKKFVANYASTSTDKESVLQAIRSTCDTKIGGTSEGRTATAKEFFI